jgi:hypothetical protein
MGTFLLTILDSSFLSKREVQEKPWLRSAFGTNSTGLTTESFGTSKVYENRGDVMRLPTRSSFLKRPSNLLAFRILIVVATFLLANIALLPQTAFAAEKVQIDVRVQDAKIYGDKYTTDVGRSFNGWNLSVLNSSGSPVSFEYQGQTVTTLQYSGSNVPSIFVEPGSYSLRVTCDSCESHTTQRASYLNSLLRYEAWVTVNHLVTWRGTLRDTGFSDLNSFYVLMPFVTIRILEGNSLVAQTVSGPNGEFQIPGLKTGVPYSVSLICYIYSRARACPGNSPVYTINSYPNYRLFWGNISLMEWSESASTRSDVYLKRAFYDSYSVTGTLSVTNTNPSIGSAVSCLSNLDTQGDFNFEVGGTIVSTSIASYTITPQDAGKTFRCSVTQNVPFKGLTKIATGIYPVAQLDSYTVAPMPAVQVGTKVTPKPYSSDPLVSFDNFSWYVDGVLVSDNKPTYVPVPSDEGKSLTYKVSAIKTGYSQKTLLSQSRVVAPGDLGYSVPTVVGAFNVGSTLTALAGPWDPEYSLPEWPDGVSIGTSFTYQWLRDGIAIAGATTSTFLLTALDANCQISVRVMSSAQGFDSSTQTSAPSMVELGRLSYVPKPSLGEGAKVGKTIQVNRGVWDEGVELSYFWYFDDARRILGANTDSYTPPVELLGKSIFVVVRGSKPGFDPTSRQSDPVLVTEGDLILTPTPSLSGFPRVGSTLTAVHADWDEGVELTYEWFRDGKRISGGWRESFTLTEADYGREIHVAVTGSVSGFLSSTRTSSALTVDFGRFTSTTAPSIKGLANVASTLRANPGSWQEGALLSYQWLRNGVEITGATGLLYVPTVADFGQELSFIVTASAPLYLSSSETSPSVSVGEGSFSNTPTPVLFGPTEVGQYLNIRPSEWDQEASLAYQWLRNGVAIPSARSRSYLLTAADFTQEISVQVTGSATGYSSSVLTSEPLLIDRAGRLATLPKPAFSGVLRPFSTLTAIPGVWDEGVYLSYQWLRDGNKIMGATGNTYLLTPADGGHKVSLAITGSAAGYNPSTVKSDSSSVDFPSLALTPIPTLSGDAKVGLPLTAVPGLWDAGVSLTYQWLRDGVTIEGAFNRTYTLTGLDHNCQVAVRVTGSATGYYSAFQISEQALVGTGSLSSTPPPSVNGVHKVSSTLTANSGQWLPVVSVSYRWLRDGFFIVGQTNPSYTLQPEDAGRHISVEITGSAPGYFQSTQTSTPTLVSEGTFDSAPIPFISGNMKVGSWLSVVSGLWNQASSFAYSWLRDGVAIDSASSSTYLLSTADYGHDISVAVTGSAYGYISSTQMSVRQRVVAGNMNLTSTPTLSGVAKVGSTLNVILSTSDSESLLTYQWLRDGVAIPKRTLSSYLVTAADLGNGLSVEVTYSRLGYLSVTKSTSIKNVTIEKMIVSLPRISGAFKSGQTVRAVTKPWVKGSSITYAWLLNGKPIPGAKGQSIKLTSAQKGRMLSLKVTQSCVGYFLSSATSARYKVG